MCKKGAWRVAERCEVEKVGKYGADAFGEPPLGLCKFGGGGAVDGTCAFEVVASPDGEKEAFMKLALLHTPVVEHATDGYDIRHVGFASVVGDLDVGDRPHAMEVDEVMLWKQCCDSFTRSGSQPW